MHKLQTAYTVYYNLRHRRARHLMQGRFGAEPVAGDEYLLKLSRYIHLNPVFVRGVKNLAMDDKLRHLRSYPWSGFRGYTGMEKPYGFMDGAPILMLIENRAKQQRRAYQAFVEAGIAETDDAFRELLKASRWGIGDEAFQARMRDLHTAVWLCGACRGGVHVGALRRNESARYRRLPGYGDRIGCLPPVFGACASVLRATGC